jgi:hypothetical protein
MSDQYQEPPEDFRRWADDPENVEAADRVMAEFVAEEGVEMAADLFACRGLQHQGTAERWMERLRGRFEQWWSAGRPQLGDSPRVAVADATPAAEREARSLLASNLPPGAAFALTRRWRKLAAGAVEADGWSCDVYDGRASAMGRGESPVAAAQRALDSWRDFVTGSRVDLSMAVGEESATDRPPQLNAPSAAKIADDDAGRKAV